MCLNSKGWLNFTRTLLRADYIGFLLLRLDNWCEVDYVVNKRMFSASLIYMEQFYIWFLGVILCG